MEQWWSKLGAVCAIFLTGCANQDPPDWYGDDRFSEEERAAIEEGTAWLYAQVGEPAPRISWTLRVDSEGVLPGTIRRGYGPSRATGECAGGAIFIATGEERIEMQHLPGLAAHELAHCAFGFVDGYHAGEVQTDGIMRVLAPMRWTDAERAQCASSASCPKK